VGIWLKNSILAAVIRFANASHKLLEQVIGAAKQMEDWQEARRLAELGTRTAILAHEAANALNSVYWTAQQVKNIIPAQHHELTNALMVELHRLKKLLTEFRSLSGSAHLQLTMVQIPEIVDHILKTQAVAWSQQGIRVIKEFSGDLGLTGDRDKLHQMILNLCRNAVEAMPEGGIVNLKAYTDGDDIILEIRDTGIGIPEGMEIFEPFVTTKSAGSGLGMYVVQQIVLAHRGEIIYRSQERKGTTFRITLPKHAT
jgi:signal transduction histidine kinase